MIAPDADGGRLSMRHRVLQRQAPRIIRWQDAWTRTRYAQALPHMRPDTEIGPGGVVIGGDRVHFGTGVRIGRRCRLQTILTSGGDEFQPTIELGDGVSAEDDCHIGAIGLVRIESDVLIASGVLILDHAHSYDSPEVPVKQQRLVGGGLTIGSGSHIGENACLIGAITLGRHCVVGANSVVVRDVPELTVVAGAPARPVKRYDPAAGAWVRV